MRLMAATVDEVAGRAPVVAGIITLTLLEGDPVRCAAVGEAVLAFDPVRVVERVITAWPAGFTVPTAEVIMPARDAARG